MPARSKRTTQALSRAGQSAAATLRRQDKQIVLSPAVKAAVEMMVFQGKQRPEAAENAGLKDDSLRSALTKPHVLAYLNECMEMLRTSLRPRALHTMGELLDAKTDTIKFKAAEYLDGQNRGQHTIGAAQVNVQVNNTVNVTPGYVIDLRADEPDGLPKEVS
ncbi:hypothetical protein [Rhizobium sp. Leaf453]|uniref:hypothetical protein n=1 Tax=Rhizobium sp. Leaf453 TaxID=1736380 RepID=UPI0007127C18|nr:hypothetical protein [Rhizobium sp. Leaf453]KQT96957.1 hypothetical protein ASG68_08340 [Rhizobium sp. Leaf453]